MSVSKLVLGVLALAACADDRSLEGAETTRFQAHLDAMRGDGIVGLVGEIDTDHGRAQAHSGVTAQGGDQPVALDSHFRIASNTKTFVAIVMLQLAHEGKLHLDDSVETWLPGLITGNGNDGTKITIRNLLQHTSGLFNYTKDVFASVTPDTLTQIITAHREPQQLVAIALQHPPVFAPGTSWSYSNTNYVVAGMIIQKVTGHDWRSEVQTRILTPLRLTETSLPTDDMDLPAPHASGYQAFGGALFDVTQVNQTLSDAAGSMTSTTADLTRFWRALQSGELLEPAEMTAMHTTVPVDDEGDIVPGSRYGLGIIWFPTSCGGGYWNHEGDTLGFQEFNAVNDAGTAAVVVSLSTSPISAAAQAEEAKLLDDVMCAK
jgi:D-alanyl-D-alanine carboxypeptidase